MLNRRVRYRGNLCACRAGVEGDLSDFEGDGVTPAQVVVRWHVDRQVVVIPKSASPEVLISAVRMVMAGEIYVPSQMLQGEPPPLEEVLKTMRERAGKFTTEKVRQEDLATAGGAADEAD